MLLSPSGARSASIRARNSGLPQTDILFEELTDPRGIRFWPEDKGRDGCRTPIPWDEGESPNWLHHRQALAAGQIRALGAQCRNAERGPGPRSSNLHRAILAFRKEHPALIDGDIAFFEDRRAGAGFPPHERRGKPRLCLAICLPKMLKVTCDGDADILLSQAAERLKGKLDARPQWLGHIRGAGGEPASHRLQTEGASPRIETPFRHRIGAESVWEDMT